jgi:hypothetical protein
MVGTKLWLECLEWTYSRENFFYLLHYSLLSDSDNFCFARSSFSYSLLRSELFSASRPELRHCFPTNKVSALRQSSLSHIHADSTEDLSGPYTPSFDGCINLRMNEFPTVYMTLFIIFKHVVLHILINSCCIDGRICICWTLFIVFKTIYV